MVVLIHGGPIDVSDMQASSRVGAVVTAWYPGQHGSAALADILIGARAPSGRTPVTWYRESYCSLPMTDMRMRADAHGNYPGRTHRYWRGPAPLYPFGHGLSYTTFAFNETGVAAAASSSAAVASVSVVNTGAVASDLAVLLFMRYLGGGGGDKPTMVNASLPSVTIDASGCSSAGARTDLVQRLVTYQRTGELAPGATASLDFEVRLGGGVLSAWAGFGDPRPPCGAYALRFGQDGADALMVRLTAVAAPA